MPIFLFGFKSSSETKVPVSHLPPPGPLLSYCSCISSITTQICTLTSAPLATSQKVSLSLPFSSRYAVQRVSHVKSGPGMCAVHSSQW